MKKMFILAFMSAVCLTSCRHGVEMIEETGTLKLNVSSLTDFITVNTKAEGENEVIDFTNTAAYDVVVKGPTPLTMKYSEFTGKVIELGSGTYEITVTSPLTEPAAFEQPIYQAHETFEIKAGEVTPLDLTCTPANCKVTIELSENFVKELASYEVTVSNGLGQLVWTKNSEKNDFAEGSSKAGYFLPRGLEIMVSGFRSIDNTSASAVHYIEQTLPAEHHVIRLDAKVTGQIGGIGINVVTDFTEKSEDVEVGGMDETYVDRPDFGEDDGNEEEEDLSPSIVWTENPFFDPISIKKGDQISMTVKAPLGFKSFRVEVSDNFKPAVAMIAQKDYIDLVNDVDIWQPFGLPVGEQVFGQQQLVFELTPFIDTLCGAAAGMTVQFILIASDSEDNYILIDDEYPTVTINVPA